jgi:hypothetical protein
MPESSVRLPAPRRNAFLLRPGSLRRPPIDKPDHHVSIFFYVKVIFRDESLDPDGPKRFLKICPLGRVSVFFTKSSGPSDRKPLEKDSSTKNSAVSVSESFTRPRNRLDFNSLRRNNFNG